MAKTLDISECAEFFKIDPTTASKLAARGEIPGAKIGRAWVFLEEDLVEYLRKQVRIQSLTKESDAIVDDQLAEAVRTTRPMAVSSSSPMRRKANNKLVLPQFAKNQ